VGIILASLPEELDPKKTDDDFGDFIFAPYAEFVARYGCHEGDLLFSLNALKEITKRFSAEDAIRYYLNAFPDKTLTLLEKWSKESNYHVRRLVSEGTRPNLPWSQKVNLDHERVIRILDNIYRDRTRYVVRSVANHMNDLSKIDPELVLKTLRRWERTGMQTTKEMEYLKKHALRTLIKKGNAKALCYLGFVSNPVIAIENFRLESSKIRIGEALVFTFDIRAKKKTQLMIDYVITFANTSGKVSSKTYKLKQLHMQTGGQEHCIKRHPLRLMTTRKLHPGKHVLQLQINGQIYATKYFYLMVNNSN
jgi:3-methyladenine DNA glycosylase AlkC